MICYIWGDVFYLIICSEETLTKCYSELIMVKNECALILLYDFLLESTVPFLSLSLWPAAWVSWMCYFFQSSSQLLPFNDRDGLESF